MRHSCLSKQKWTEVIPLTRKPSSFPSPAHNQRSNIIYSTIHWLASPLLVILLTCLPLPTHAHTILLRDNTPKGMTLADNVLPALRSDHSIFTLLRGPANKYFVVHNRTGQLTSARAIDRDLMCAESGLCCALTRMDLRSVPHRQNMCPNHMYGSETQVCLFNLSVSVVAAQGQQPDIYEVGVIVCEENDHTPAFEPIQPNQQANSPWKLATDAEHLTSASTYIYQINVSESAPVGHRQSLPLAHDIDAVPFQVQQYRLELLHPQVHSTNGFDVDPFGLELIRENEPGQHEFRLGETRSPVTGVFLVLKEPLDRETIPRYSYHLLAVDGGLPPRTGTLQVQVRVLDTNDHAPQFEQSIYQKTVDEGVVGRELLRVVATDMDEGANAVIRYGWATWSPVAPVTNNGSTGSRTLEHYQPKTKDELALAPPSYWFRLNSETGGLYVQQPLDYEVKRQHRFQVVAYNPVDGSSAAVSDRSALGSQTATATVIIDVRNLDDEPPHIVVDYATGNGNDFKEIRENDRPSYFVAFITVSDPDWPDSAVTGGTFGSYHHDHALNAFGCQLDSHQESYVLERDKVIHSPTSVGVRYSLSTKVSLDRERSSEDRILIICHDSGTPPKVATAFVTVKVLDENDCEPELQVFVPTPELGSRSAPVKPWPRDMFGHVLERHPDSPVPLISAYITGTPVYSVRVSENQPINTIVAQVRATDKDSGENGRVTFELPTAPVMANIVLNRPDTDKWKTAYFADSREVELLSSPEAQDYFYLDAVKGDLSTRKVIDRENLHTFSDHFFVLIKATDHGRQVQHSTVICLLITVLDENDNPPVFITPTMHFEIAENVPAPALVGEVRVYDPDLDRTTGLFADSAQQLPSSLVAGPPTRRARLHVRIDPGHGTPSLPFIIYRVSDDRFHINTTRMLNRESEEAFQFGLIATDNDSPHGLLTHLDRGIPGTRHTGHTATASVLVTVVDVNDNPPEIIFPNPSTSNASIHRISYREYAGYDILHINANDRDAGASNGKFYFELLPDSRSVDLFSVDRSTGVLRTRRRLTKDDLGEHILQAVVRDEGTPPLETRLTLRLLVDQSEPRHQPDSRPGGSFNKHSGSNIHPYETDLQNAANSLQSAVELGGAVDNRWDSRRIMQFDVLLIVIVAMIMILMVIMIFLCFYLRHKRNLFVFLPDLCGSCLSTSSSTESTDLTFTQKLSPRLKHRLDAGKKRTGHPFDATYSGLMESLLGCEHQQRQEQQQQHQMTVQAVDSTPMGSPGLGLPQVHQNAGLAARFHSSIHLNRFPTHDPNAIPEDESRSRLSFSPTMIGSDLLCSAAPIPVTAYRSDTSVMTNIPDVADHAENSRKFYVDYNQVGQQPIALHLANKPRGGGGYVNSQGRCGVPTNTYNLGHYMLHHMDPRPTTVDSRFPQIDFRPIPDELHLYQRIRPDDPFGQQQFRMRSTEPDPALLSSTYKSKGHGQQNGDNPLPSPTLVQSTLGSWRSDPSLCPGTEELDRFYSTMPESHKTLGVLSRSANHQRNSSLRRSTSNKPMAPQDTEHATESFYAETKELLGPTSSSTAAHHKASRDPTVQARGNYAVAFPQIQASFV